MKESYTLRSGVMKDEDGNYMALYTLAECIYRYDEATNTVSEKSTKEVIESIQELINELLEDINQYYFDASMFDDMGISLVDIPYADGTYGQFKDTVNSRTKMAYQLPITGLAYLADQAFTCISPRTMRYLSNRGLAWTKFELITWEYAGQYGGMSNITANTLPVEEKVPGCYVLTNGGTEPPYIDFEITNPMFWLFNGISYDYTYNHDSQFMYDVQDLVIRVVYSPDQRQALQRQSCRFLVARDPYATTRQHCIKISSDVPLVGKFRILFMKRKGL